ncbi:hypothetical protein D3C81_1385080 [compost metagenome]
MHILSCFDHCGKHHQYIYVKILIAYPAIYQSCEQLIQQLNELCIAPHFQATNQLLFLGLIKSYCRKMLSFYVTDPNYFVTTKDHSIIKCSLSLLKRVINTFNI